MVESSGIREMVKAIKVNMFEEMREALHDAASYKRCKPVDFRVANKVGANAKPPHPQKRRVRQPASVGDVKRRKTHPFPAAAGRGRRREKIAHPRIFCETGGHPRGTFGYSGGHFTSDFSGSL